MKRLLIDINSIVPYLVSGKRTGISRTTMELINSLIKINVGLPFKICLFTQNLKGIKYKELSAPYFHLYLPNRKKINKLISFFPIREIISRYDLIHIPHNFEYLHRPEKSIITLHDALFMHIKEKAFDHSALEKEAPRLLRRCKGIITCSNYSKADISKTMDIDPDKIKVIYWGIDHNSFFHISDKEKVMSSIIAKFNIIRPYFLSVSCNAERKSSHKLIEAYLNLGPQYPENDLVLVWTDPPFHVNQMIEKSKYRERIHLLKDISDVELNFLYNGATALFFPSSYEGFGLPILEAMSCGIPVVTSNNTSLSEIGGSLALYMNEPSVENIINYFEEFENGKCMEPELSERRISYASRFTWERAAREYVSVYLHYFNVN
jgi:glycosyltransferase involved in cell wall biosynthesis